MLPSATTRMDLEGIVLREVSQTEKDKCIWFQLYVESKKLNKQMKQKQTQIQRTL